MAVVEICVSSYKLLMPVVIVDSEDKAANPLIASVSLSQKIEVTWM